MFILLTCPFYFFVFGFFLGDGECNGHRLGFSQFWGPLGCSGEEFVPAAYFWIPTWFLTGRRGPDLLAR